MCCSWLKIGESVTDRNENKPGYKKTKVGWVPEEWEVQPFGYLTRKSQYGLSMPASESGKTPIIRMGNIEEGRIIYKNLSYVNISAMELLKYSVKRNDLLFNRTNSLDLVGKLGIVSEPKPVVFASYIIRFQIKNSLGFPPFVAYYFNAPELSWASSESPWKIFAFPGPSSASSGASPSLLTSATWPTSGSTPSSTT